MQVTMRCFFRNEFFPVNPESGEREEKFEFHAHDEGGSVGGRNTPITEYEKCLITLMRFHRRVTLVHLELIWGRHFTTIGQYIQEWAPKLGNAGLQISILDITEEFLHYAMPEDFKEAGLAKVGVLVDGKVFMTHECRVHNGIKRAQYSDEVHHGGVLMHEWILPCGLSVEHTPLYLARLSESALVRLWGCSTKKI
jgi:hypothetical protein